MEIDFLVAKPTVTSRHNISPIEVKSGKNYTLSSLRKCLTKYADHMATPYVLHEQDLKSEDGILYLPLYMTPLLLSTDPAIFLAGSENLLINSCFYNQKNTLVKYNKQ